MSKPGPLSFLPFQGKVNDFLEHLRYFYRKQKELTCLRVEIEICSSLCPSQINVENVWFQHVPVLLQ